jgi:hypothetical protein
MGAARSAEWWAPALRAEGCGPGAVTARSSASGEARCPYRKNRRARHGRAAARRVPSFDAAPTSEQARCHPSVRAFSQARILRRPRLQPRRASQTVVESR